MLRISFVYLLLYVPYMQNFKKMHAREAAGGAKLGLNGPYGPNNNRDLLFGNFIYTIIKFQVLKLILVQKIWNSSVLL